MMTINEFATELKKYPSVLIFTHIRPDGDTLGSAAALRLALMTLNKKADIICPSQVPQKYSYFDFYRIVSGDAAGEYSAHIAVDCSTEQMLACHSGLFFKSKNTFNIDHHTSNTRYAAYNYVAERGANAENVLELIKALGAKIDRVTAEDILLGVVTDTGCFSHKNVTKETLAAASELVGYGADLNKINYLMFKLQKKERAALFARAAASIKYYHGGALAMITVRSSDFEATGATQDMTEGFIDFPLSVEGVEVAVSVMESGDKRFKISYRSNGRVDVNAVASTFGGGGHKLASGSMLSGYYEDVVDKLVYTVGQYL